MLNKELLLKAIGHDRRSQEVKNLLNYFSSGYQLSKAPDNDDYYLEFKAEGVSLLFNKEDCLNAIFLYIAPREGFSPYKGWIGEGLTSSSTKDKVISTLGTPKATGGGTIGMFNLFIPVWTTHIYEEIVLLHYQYDNSSNKVERLGITLLQED